MNKVFNCNSGASYGALYLTLVRFITIILSFIVARLLSQYLSKYDYGTYSQAILLISTISSITILGMCDAINFFFCKGANKVEKDKYISTIFCLQYIMGIISFTIVLLFMNQICNYFNNNDLKSMLIIVAISPMIQNIISMLQILYIAIGKSRLIALRNLIYSILKLIIVYISCKWMNSVFMIIFIVLLVDILQVMLFKQILKKNGYTFSIRNFDKRIIKTILSYSIPMAAFTVISTLTRDMDKYLISNFLDTESLAVYTNAAKILPFDIIMSSFCTVLLPYITNYIAKKNYEKSLFIYKLFLQLTYITTTIFACTVLVSASDFMELLYTDKYIDGIYVFIIYIIVDIVRFTNITIVLSSAGKTKTIMNISILGLFLNLIFNIMFFYLFGFEGPAISTLFMTIVIGMLMLYFSSREMHSKIRDLFDLKYLLLFLIMCSIVGVCCFLINLALMSLNIYYFIRIIISSGLFFVIMLFICHKKIFRLVKIINKIKLYD